MEEYSKLEQIVFDHFIDKLSNHTKMIVKISFPLDENGFFDRKCPNASCGIFFKILFEDWKIIVKDEAVYCPVCRFEAPSSNWNTPLQSKYIESHAYNKISNEINRTIQKVVRNFNENQIPGMITMSLSYKPGNVIIPIPPSTMKELQQIYKCNNCNCNYSLLGFAYFCPSCGNTITLETVEIQMNNIDNFIKKFNEFKDSFIKSFEKEDSEKYIIQLTEDYYCKIVSLLQIYSDHLFRNFPDSSKIEIRKNLFQNLDESSTIWKKLTGLGYENILTSECYIKLKLYFQRRHLLIHTNGIVDESYVFKTNDTSYTIGQRILIRKEDLSDFYEVSCIFMENLKKNFLHK